MKTPFYKAFLPLDLQTFAGEGGDGGQSTGNDDDSGSGGGNQGGGEGGQPPQLTPELEAYFAKLLQSEKDKVRTEWSKRYKSLETEAERLKKEHMTEQQRAEYEAQQRQQALDERSRELDRKNMELIATTELSASGLPVAFRDMVVGVDEKGTKANIANLKSLIEERVNAEVTERIRSGGRNVAGGRTAGSGATDANAYMNNALRRAFGRA